MKIYDITKCLSGNVLGIGVDFKISDLLSSNDRVLECNLLDSSSGGSKGSFSSSKLKKINIRKLRKVFKKKKVDFILCNVDCIKKYFKTFVKDSIYINKDMLYIYNVSDLDVIDELEHKYKRYNVSIEKLKDGKTYILKIDNKKSKTNFFKDCFYFIIDTIVGILNALSNLLLN